MKKALKWLTEHNIQHKLHDYRVDGLDTQFLQQAEAQFGWENLVNKRSTTWRNLDEDVKNTLSKSTALSVLAENPTLIKRPIILQDGKLNRVECKSGFNFNNSAVKSFKQLDKTQYALGAKVIISNTDTVYPLDDGVYVLPLSGI